MAYQPYHTQGYYLHPGWYYPPPPAPRSAGNSPHNFATPLPATGVFIPSPPTQPVLLPPSPSLRPVYPPPELPRVRRHSFDASTLPAAAAAPWPVPVPSPGSPWAYPYSWFWNSRPLPAPALHPLLDDGFEGEHLLADLSAYHFSLRSRRGLLSRDEREAPATSPAITRIRIVCDLIPQWPLDVTVVGTTITPSRSDRAANGTITVEDVIYAIHDHLQKQITHAEWGKLSQAQEIEVARSYTRRCKAYPPVETQLRAAGVKRVDFLGKKFYFRGLVWLAPEGGYERLRLVVDSREDS